MRVGVLRETKDREMRVALLPGGARVLAQAGHEVAVESGAGAGSGFSDSAYKKAGAEIAAAPAELIRSSDLIVKVKEPTESEVAEMRPGQILLTSCTWRPTKP